MKNVTKSPILRRLARHLASLVLFVIACQPSGPPSPPGAPDAYASLGDAAPSPFVLTPFFTRAPRAAAPTPVPEPIPAWYSEPAFGHSGRGLQANAAAASFVTNGPPPVFQLSWTQPTWVIDPANATGCASDKNATCSSATCTVGDGPCLHYSQVAARWATYSPRLGQDTTITFQSSQSLVTDPVILRPFMDNGAHFTLQGVLTSAQQLASGTLSGLVAKSRGNPGQLLQATFAAGLATGTLIVNTTHSSRAWLYANQGGNVWTVTQPLPPSVIPITTEPAEVNTWANLDAYVAYAPVTVNLVDFEPQLEALNTSTFDNTAVVYQLNNLIPPVAVGGGLTVVGPNVEFVECDVNIGQIGLTGGGLYFQWIWANDYFASDVISLNTPPPRSFAGGTITNVNAYWGGAFTSNSEANGAFLDLDLIVGGGNFSGVGTWTGTLGTVYIDSTTTLAVAGLITASSGAVIWGPGTLALQGQTRMGYTATQATAAFKSALTMNGGTTACSHTNGSPDVISCGISVTGAHLDAAQGAAGFGGLAFLPGGASISSSGL
jgi:hypothetical protein